MESSKMTQEDGVPSAKETEQEEETVVSTAEEHEPRPPPHPGLVSQVELSYMALNIGGVNLSASSIVKAAADHEPHNLRGTQLKVRVKTYHPAEEDEEIIGEGEESGLEDEQELEKEEDVEDNDTGDLSPSIAGVTRELPPLSPEEALPEFTTLLTAKHTVEEDGDMDDEEESKRRSSSPDKLETLKSDKETLLEKDCVLPEVFTVWKCICNFIVQKLLEGFGVRIPGLGTFSYVVIPSNNLLRKSVCTRFPLRKTRRFPIFKICPHVKEMYTLSEQNHQYQSNLPMVPLNTAAVAASARLEQSRVNGIILETLQSFVTGIITNKDLEFPFPSIGKLYVTSQKVFMIFYQQFCDELSFDFDYCPTFKSSVFSGNMTPLTHHRPAPQFRSVFHYGELRTIEEQISANPQPYTKGGVLTNVLSNPCQFKQEENESGESTPCARYFNSLAYRQKACCAEQGGFIFNKSDGSSFTPEPLQKAGKTGNPVLDRLAVDRCFLRETIGCWMSRKVVATLGKEKISRHYDRDYFKKKFGNGGDDEQRSYFKRGQCPVTPEETMSPEESEGSEESLVEFSGEGSLLLEEDEEELDDEQLFDEEEGEEDEDEEEMMNGSEEIDEELEVASRSSLGESKFRPKSSQDKGKKTSRGSASLPELQEGIVAVRKSSRSKSLPGKRQSARKSQMEMTTASGELDNNE